jgi:hypothetical protein
MAEQEKKAGSKLVGIGITLLILLALAFIILWVTK